LKILDVKTHIMEAELPKPFYWSQSVANKRGTLLVEVITDEGITGWGESFCATMPPHVPAAVVEKALKEVVVGEDPFDTSVLWEKMYNHTRMYGQKGAVIEGIAGIDIALWDIKGKALNMPVYKLLGGAYRTEIQPYATGFYRVEGGKYPEDAVKEALGYVEAGFSAMKLKIGFGVKEDTEYIYAIRKAVGPDIGLMADVNYAYDVPKARRLLYDTEGADLIWLEEPISPEDIEGYKELKNLTRTYIAAGECEFTKIAFKEWIQRRAVDILQPDLCAAGGYTECMKILAMAEAYHTQVCPHIWGSGIGLAAALQFLAVVPPSPLAIKPVEPRIEFDQSSHPFRHDLIYGAIKMDKDGIIRLPEAAGIGVEINREVIEKYSR